MRYFNVGIYILLIKNIQIIMHENYNPYSFSPTDIIMWNGILTSFGSISHLMSEDDYFRTTNEAEKKQYRDAPEKNPYVIN